MTTSIYRPRFAGLLLAVLWLATSTTSVLADFSISNNLTTTSGGTEEASGTNWLSAGFATGSTGGQLSSVVLLLSNSIAGKVEVDLYSDGGEQPGSLLGTLSSSGTVSTSLTNTTFTASGITLAANTDYWVVVKALSGQFDWSWDADDTGTGVGYQNTWASSFDSGTDWFSYGDYPTQMNVLLVSSASVPEPGTWILWGLAIASGLALRKLVRPENGSSSVLNQSGPTLSFAQASPR